MTPNRKDSERRRRPPQTALLNVLDTVRHIDDLQRLGLTGEDLRDCMRRFNRTFWEFMKNS